MMKSTFYSLGFICIISISCLSCTENKLKTKPFSSSVVKIIKTTTYSTKTEFNELKTKDPEYDLVYDKKIGTDLKWNIKHLDKYSNIIYQENFTVDSNGKAKITCQIINEYYSNKDSKLSSVTKNMDNYITKELYIRNSKGILTEIRTYDNNELRDKEVFQYNKFGQRIKSELFVKEGLHEDYSWTYDRSSLKEGKIINEIHKTYDKSSNWEETEYSWNNSGFLNMTYNKFYQESVLLTDLKTTFESYVGKVPTIEISDGFDNMIIQRNNNGKINTKNFSPPFHRIIHRILNNKGDITKYEVEHQDKGKSDQKLDSLFSYYKSQINVEYFYNKRNDWTKLILSVDHEKYISIREITYIEK